jgi:NADH dehydrogenase (ubiquinone) Fe-S protein 6
MKGSRNQFLRALRGAIAAHAPPCYRAPMIPPPETSRVSQPRVACDGATDIPGGAALGHPRVWLQIDETGYVDCGYCDRRFILIGGAADGADQAALRDHGDGAGR